MNQKEFLNHAMQVMNLQRRSDFAARFGITERSMAAYLLPENSKGFRNMASEKLWEIKTTLSDLAMTEKLGVKPGFHEEQAITVECPVFQFRFPSIYRVTGFDHSFDYGVLDSVRGDQIEMPLYSLEKDVTAEDLGLFEIHVEPLLNFERQDATGWVIVSEHRSLDRLDAYRRGIYQVHGSHTCISISAVVFENRFFTLYQREKPQDSDFDGIFLFESDFHSDSGKYEHEDLWQFAFDSQGNAVDPLELFE